MSKKSFQKKIVFARIGGLSSVRQRMYNPSVSEYHSPPARRGIYAFIWPFIIEDMVFAPYFRSHRMEWIRRADGSRISQIDGDSLPNAIWAFENADYYREFCNLCEGAANDPAVPQEEFDQLNGHRFAADFKKPRIFEYEGNLWHHLPVGKQPIIAHKGSWLKTSFSTFKRAFRREFHRIKAQRNIYDDDDASNPLEVFIERI